MKCRYEGRKLEVAQRKYFVANEQDIEELLIRKIIIINSKKIIIINTRI